jgi:hypothetical protein
MALLGRDYLAPDVQMTEGVMKDIGYGDKGDIGSLLTLGIIGASMVGFPHIARGALKGIVGAGKFAGRAAWGTTKGAARTFTSKGFWRGAAKGAGRVATTGYEAATGFASGAGKFFSHVSRHPGAYTAAAFGGAALFGGATAMRTGSPYEAPESYYHTGRPGLPADNMGATGDLTLALHNGR